MNKKIGLLVVLSLVVFNFLIGIVSAAFYYDARQGMQQVIDGVVDFSQPLLQVLLGGYNWTGYLLFEAFLLFMILVALIYLSLKNVEVFSDNPAVLWIIALAVPIMGIRFLDFQWLMTIIIQYKVLAIALTAGLPFIIYFLFLYNVLGEYDVLRKVAWIFFAVIFLGLWSTTGESTYGEVYLWTALLALLFFLMDGTIRRTMLNQKMKALGGLSREQFQRELQRQIRQLDQDLTNNIITAKQHKKIKRRLQDQLNALLKN